MLTRLNRIIGDTMMSKNPMVFLYCSKENRRVWGKYEERYYYTDVFC